MSQTQNRRWLGLPPWTLLKKSTAFPRPSLDSEKETEKGKCKKREKGKREEGRCTRDGGRAPVAQGG